MDLGSLQTACMYQNFLLLSVANLLAWGVLSGDRSSAGPPLRSYPRVRVPRDDRILYCLRFGTLPTRRARSPYLYPPGTGWPSYNPRHWVPFSSPYTTRRSIMEVFKPTSTQTSQRYRDQTGLTLFREIVAIYSENTEQTHRYTL
jgi:hypothetical protein